MIWVFGDCELDDGLYQLRRAGRVVKVEPKVFDLLRYLLERRERMVSKAELLDALWSGEAVSESVLPRSVAGARRAVGDDRTHQRVIQTVHGRGYRLVADVTAPDSTATTERVETSTALATHAESDFVGRKPAMSRLESAFEDALGGRGRMLLLVGEPGIGKTRTTEELVSRARERAAVYAGRCYEGGGAPSYWPYVQILRELVEDLPDDELVDNLRAGAPDLVQLAPELGRRVPDIPASEPLEGEQARFRLFDSMAGLLSRCAARRPLVLVLDDLHWADTDSLLLTRFLVGSLRDARVLIVATYRDVEVRRQQPLGELLGALSREPHCERLSLRGLDHQEVGALIAGAAGITPDPRLARAVHEMTEGNPFFVREVARLLAEEGRLQEPPPESLELVLPQSVRDAVGRRLDSLSDDCNGLLRSAAVIGREFGGRLLTQLAEQPYEVLLELLGEALASQILVEVPGAVDRYAFSHALVRQTLYEELSVPQRVAAHRRVGEIVERTGGGAPGEHLAELAHHYFQASAGGDSEPAIEYCVRAAEQAEALCAYDDAVRHYGRALEALGLVQPIDEVRRCRLLVATAEARWAAGQRAPSRRDFAEAAELARRHNEVELLVRCAVGLRSYGELGTRPDAQTISLLEEALDAVGKERPALRARVLSRLACSEPYSISMATRETLSSEAYELAIRSEDPQAIHDALSARYWAALGPDRPDARLAIGREAIARGERFGDPRLSLLGHEALLGGHLLLGEFDQVSTHVEAFRRIAEELRQPVFEFLAFLVQGSFELNRGHFEAARQYFDRAIERGRGTVLHAEIIHAGSVYWLHNLRGDRAALSDFGPLLQDLMEAPPASGLTRLIQGGVAAERLDAGDRNAALAILEEMIGFGFERLERDEHWMVTMSAYADVALQLGDQETCEQIFPLFAPYEGLMLSHDLLRAGYGSVASVLGALAGALGRSNEAEERLRAAIAREQAIGAVPAILTSKTRLAWELRCRGDADGVAQLLRELSAEGKAIGSFRDFAVELENWSSSKIHQ